MLLRSCCFCASVKVRWPLLVVAPSVNSKPDHRLVERVAARHVGGVRACEREVHVGEVVRDVGQRQVGMLVFHVPA
jgi:hypothetical protein